MSDLRIDIFTLFPAMFAGPFDSSIIGRARVSGQIEIAIHDIRAWTRDRHHTADDTPYGGGAGMVMMAPPIVEAVESVLGDDLARTRIIILSAAGWPFRQQTARELANAGRIALICGHYEGIDDRVTAILHAEELSVGDYVLTGGELPAMIVADAVIRLVPGVIDAASTAEESHSDDEPLVEYPQFTRPVEYRGLRVPDILLSGHHANIAAWRHAEARRRTAERRPDLLAKQDPGEATAENSARDPRPTAPPRTETG